MNKKKIGDISFDITNGIILSLFAFICVFPLYYIFIITISDNKIAGSTAILFYPIGMHFDNYLEVFRLEELFNATFISISRTVLGTALTLIGTSFLGYLFTKKEMFLRTILYRLVIITMYFSAGLIPWYVTMKALGLTNNFLGYIIPGIINAYYLILIKTYIESIPTSLEESAEIDGAGILTIFWKIILPLSKPILATIAVFASVGQWNSLMDNIFLMTTNTKLNTLQFLLYKYMSEVDTLAMRVQQMGANAGETISTMTPTSLRMTVAIVVVIPVILVYPMLQRYFQKGIMLGAVKG